jgi:hypothetical protein
MNGSTPDATSVQKYVANLSTALARSIYEMLTGQPTASPVTVDPLLVRNKT